MSSDFLPVQLVYQEKTTKSLSCIDFPGNWHITVTPNHWCNESTTIDYVTKIIVPYLQEKRKELGLPANHPALAIFDAFKGQNTEKVLTLLEQNNIFYVMVPPNCTDRLQPLDVSVNKAAKDFLKGKFHEWYADKVTKQIDGQDEVTPVDLRLSIMKPIGAKWIIELHDYLKTKPDIIINGFKGAGIIDAIRM